MVQWMTLQALALEGNFLRGLSTVFMGIYLCASRGFLRSIACLAWLTRYRRLLGQMGVYTYGVVRMVAAAWKDAIQMAVCEY
jgi:hypothetical protein